MCDLPPTASVNCLATTSCIDSTPAGTGPDGWIYEAIGRNGAKTTLAREACGLVLTRTQDADGASPILTSYTWHPALRLPLTITTSQVIATSICDVDGLLRPLTQTDNLTGSPSCGQSRTWTYVIPDHKVRQGAVIALPGRGLGA